MFGSFIRLHGAEMSRVPAAAPMSCSAGECPGNHNDYDCASAMASRAIEVRLEINGRQSRHVWMSTSTTIAQALNEWTPEDTNLVVFVNGGVAQPDMVLSGFPTNGGFLRMTIQQPMEW